MTSPLRLALIGPDAALAAVLQEHAQNAEGLSFTTGEAIECDLAIFSAADDAALAGFLGTARGWKKTQAQRISLLVLGENVAEPAGADEVFAGVFKKPLRLAALLDAGFTALRLAALKGERKLSKTARLDPFTRTLGDEASGKSETLTPKEADLLLALLEAGEKGLAREAALTRIWGYHRDVDSHAVETAAWRLRRKLEGVLGSAAGLESREGRFFLRIGA
ncbi:MAG TPA: winged helix-turn-helix domain-containing protein [Alphaproteobacteria bacterium]|nr:winged helix-turn-helix domain-containing protein [Alphaproteobacteria bacterium]